MLQLIDTIASALETQQYIEGLYACSGPNILKICKSAEMND